MTNFVSENFHQLRTLIDTSDVLSDTTKLNMRKCIVSIEQEFDRIDKNMSMAYDTQSKLKDILEHIIDNL